MTPRVTAIAIAAMPKSIMAMKTCQSALTAIVARKERTISAAARAAAKRGGAGGEAGREAVAGPARGDAAAEARRRLDGEGEGDDLRVHALLLEKRNAEQAQRAHAEHHQPLGRREPPERCAANRLVARPGVLGNGRPLAAIGRKAAGLRWVFPVPVGKQAHVLRLTAGDQEGGGGGEG